MRRVPVQYLVAVPPAVLAAVLFFGALGRINPAASQGQQSWSGDVFATLAWLSLAVVCLCVVLAWRSSDEQGEPLAAVGLSSQVVLFSVAGTLVLAVGSECQNYWDAYHFSALAWTFALSSVASLVAVFQSAARGSALGAMLKLPSIAGLLLSLLGWTWTWSTTLHSLASEIARSLFLLTHG